MFKIIKSKILAFLAIASFAQNGGKDVLSDEQKAKLVENFGEVFTAKFVDGLEKEADSKESDFDLKSISDFNTQITELNSKLTAEKNKTVEQQKLIDDQKGIIDTLSNKADEGGETITTTVQADDNPPAAPGYLFGVVNPINAVDSKHPWNQRALAAISRNTGLAVVASESLDYTQLQSELGEYIVRHQEAIQSFIRVLPSVESFFPLRSGLQNKAVLVNMFMDEMSMPGNNSDTNFIEKGGFHFEPEILEMYDVEVNHKFSNLKKLEQQWIGYLNKEGSQAIKWSFVQYLVQEAVKKLHNEREVRRIRGRRVDRAIGATGPAINASTGFLHYIKEKIAGFQIKPFIVGEWTPANIVEYIFDLSMMIPQAFRDTGELVAYMSSDAKIYYDKNFEALYGANSNYTGSEERVKFIKSIKTVGLPNMGYSKRMVFTIEGNFNLYELESGEYYKFSFEQEDRKLKLWSDSKEGFAATRVGKKYASAAEQTYDNQYIFCNDVDEPADYYIEMDTNDAAPSASVHSSLKSVNNEAEVSITDIEDVATGAVVRLQCGTTLNKIKILKASPNFSLLATDWIPNIGDVIILQKRADGKFIEVQRLDATSQAIAIDDDDATPDLSAGDVFQTGVNTTATAITNFENASYDITYTIHGAGAGNASTIANAGNFVLTAAMTLAADAWIKLIKSRVDGKFYEVERSA